jgi:hypothetical protein
MRPELMTADAPGTPGADLTTANRAESLRRRLEDLEDAYGPASARPDRRRDAPTSR